MTLDTEQLLLNAVSEAMEEPLDQGTVEALAVGRSHPAPDDAEPLAQWLNSTFQRTDDLMVELARPAYRFLSKQDVMDGLGIDYSDVLLMAQIATRLQLVASNIDARQATGLRIVKNG